MNIAGMIGGTSLAVKGSEPLESHDFSRLRRFRNSAPNKD
jgi:hypothetical protein